MCARFRGVITGAATSLWLVIAAALVAGGCVAPADDVVRAETENAARAPVEGSEAPYAAGTGPDSLDTVASTAPLRLVTVGDAATDPAQASPADPGDVAVVDLLYDGLTRWDDTSGTWVPDLATSMAPDRRARIWTVTLGDQRFSNGAPITAPVVAASLDRLRRAPTVVAQRLDHIAAVRALDATTVEIELTRPDANLPAVLSHPLFAVTPMPRPGVDLDGTVSSGPRRMMGDRRSVLVSSPTRGTQPEVDIELVAVGDLDEGLALIASGNAHVLHVPPSYVGPVDGSADSGVTVAYALRAATPTLRSAPVRRSLVDAIDPEAVAAVLPGLVPAVAPGTTLGEGVRVAELPRSMTLTVVGTETDGATAAESALAGSVAAQLGSVGVDVAVQELSLDDFVALVAGGGHEIIRTGWVELHPGDRPQWLLVGPGEGANVTGLADPSLAAAIRDARRSGDAAALVAVDQAIAEAGVLVPIGRLQARIVTAAGVDHVAVGRSGSLVLGG